MNRVQFGEGACEKTRKYLDSYISNELLIETNHEVLRHVEACTACAGELEARTQLRTRLKAAVNAQSVPPELQARIREKLRTDQSSGWLAAGWLTSGWPRWAMATAASFLICAGVWLNYSPVRMPGITDRPAQGVYIQKVSARLASVLKVGLSDHIHCSIFRKYPKDPPSLEKMEANLGATYKGLLPVVRAAVPGGYRIIMAHECSYANRKFIHLTFEKQGELLSLVVARRKGGESLSALPAALETSGVPVYQSTADRYQVAGFEAGEFLAYVVSDLKGKTNLQIAAELAPAVHEFLVKIPA